jgi:hypothetical protein
MRARQSMDLADYCRQLESYLCQKNGGHLIRIVGPAFERVRSWAERGVPLKIALRGIDRCCERYNARPVRRRPVRIEFCEPDILELFDDWRRAVGVGSADSSSAARKPSLASHIERVVARLIAVRPGDGRPLPDVTIIDAAVRELDGLLAAARKSRGEKRDSIMARLAQLDRELLDGAVGSLDAAAAARFRRDAETEIAIYLTRMPVDERETAIERAFRGLVRERAGLPTIAFE